MMSVLKKFKSPGGRTFVVSSRVERVEPRFEDDTLWSESRVILHRGKKVGKLWESEKYGPDLPWQVTTRELAWSGELPPTGIGFDGGPHAMVAEALAEFGRIADGVFDWRAGKRVRNVYSRTGYYQR
jgi:hypothetical protein